MRRITAGLVVWLLAGAVGAEPPRRASEGATIVGQAMRAGRPVPGTNIEIRRLFDLDANIDGYPFLALIDRLLGGPDAWKPVATVAADAKGRFEVSGLPPGVYDAEAVTAEGAFSHVSVTLPVAGARVEARVDLPVATRPLSGRVVTADGRPFAGRLLWTTEPARSEFKYMTLRGAPAALDAAGRFALPGANAGALVAVAVEPGRRAVFSEAFVPRADRPFVFVVDEGLVPLRVRVVDARTEAPIPEAAVLAKGATPGGNWTMVRGVTDAEGTCSLRAAGAGRGEVWAYKPGYQETGVREVGASGEHDVVVRLERAARIVGRVVRDADGEPVPGLRVHAAPAARRSVEWPHGHAVTGADGAFAIEGAQAGDVTIYAEGPGWVTQGATREALQEENPLRRALRAGETADIELRVVPADVVRGRVLAPDGTPVAGAVVRADTYTLDPRGWSNFAENEATRAIAATGADGRFALDPLVPGEHCALRVLAVGALEETVDGATSGDVGVRLRPGRTIEITVLDAATGQAVPAADVEVTTREHAPRNGIRASSGYGTWNGRTGSDGRLLAGPIADESRWVEARADGYVGAIAWSRDEPPYEEAFVLRLARPTTLAGRVFLPDGAPAAGAKVTFETKASGPDDAEGTTTTDEDGGFRFDDAAPSALVVKASLWAGERGSAEAQTETQGGSQDVVLRLRPESRAAWTAGCPVLVVDVVDADGKAVPEARVTVDGPNGAHWEETVEDGRATVQGIATKAPLTVVVTAARDARGRRLPFTAATSTLAAGTSQTTVRLPTGRSIEGRVVDPEGRPVGSVRLAAIPREGLDAFLADGFEPVTVSAADGTFRIGGLAEGPHVVVADPDLAWIAPEPVPGEAGARDLVVRVRTSASARIRVLGPTGNPAAGAQVRVRPSRPTARGVVAAWTDAGGEALLRGLDPDDAGTLLVQSEVGESAPREHWRPADETVRLGKTSTEARTDVLVHPDAPLEKGHNALWCAASQFAWDALADTVARDFPGVVKDGKLPLLPPARADLVERMNRRFVPHAAVDPKACVVVGGFEQDGVVEKLRAAWAATFGADAEPPELALGPLDAVGVAGLAKELPFAQPFSVHEDPASFDGGAKVLRAWGIRAYETGPGALAAAAQVTAYVPPGSGPMSTHDEVLVELRPEDANERIVLARLEPKATLEATWATVDEMLRTWTADTVEAGSLLVVPTIRLDATERFSGFEGAPIAGIQGSGLRSFTERVRFRLSETGASIGAESAVVLSMGIHPKLVFDGPFLVALRRADQRVPYFLLWVGNDALLERLVAPQCEPLDPETLAPLVGRWTIDVERTRDASALRAYALLGLESLGFAPDAKPTPEEILARHHAQYPPTEDEMTWDVRLAVRESGRAVFEMGLREPKNPDQRPETRYEVALERVDGKPALAYTDPPGPDHRDPVVHHAPITLRDGRIEITVSENVWVLRRR